MWTERGCQQNDSLGNGDPCHSSIGISCSRNLIVYLPQVQANVLERRKALLEPTRAPVCVYSPALPVRPPAPVCSLPLATVLCLLLLLLLLPASLPCRCCLREKKGTVKPRESLPFLAVSRVLRVPCARRPADLDGRRHLAVDETVILLTSPLHRDRNTC